MSPVSLPIDELIKGIETFATYLNKQSRIKEETKSELNKLISTATISMQRYLFKKESITVDENLKFVGYWDEVYSLIKRLHMKKEIKEFVFNFKEYLFENPVWKEDDIDSIRATLSAIRRLLA